MRRIASRIKAQLPESLAQYLEVRAWGRRNYAMPCPHFIKQATLKNRSIDGATFVETGTYMGSTARFAAGFSGQVVTIEPEPKLFAAAKARLADVAKIRCINGTSEDVFPELLPTLKGPINFWLDGHFSGGVTFEGSQHTPIIEELAEIEKHLKRWPAVVIMVDDIRCFDEMHPDHSNYPPAVYLVDYAMRNKLVWFFENDIFIMRKEPV